MSAPGTTSTSSSGCAPSFPSVGWNGGYVCIAHPEAGAQFDNGGVGATFCTYWGYVAHSTGGNYTCQPYADAMPGDLVSSDVNGTNAQSLSAQNVCTARGMAVSPVTVSGVSFDQCTGTAANPASDAATHDALSSLGSTLTSFASANHTDLASISSASSGSASSTSATVVTGDTSTLSDGAIASYTPVVLLSAVLTGVLLVRSWDFAKRVVGA